MINFSFEFPFVIFFLIPGLFLGIYYWRNQVKSLEKLTIYIHFSKVNLITKFITLKNNIPGYKNFYIFSSGSLISLFSLIVALANPVGDSDDSQIFSKESGVYILIDGSFSMRASDNQKFDSEYSYIPPDRNWEGRIHALALIDKCPEVAFGVFSFAEKSHRHTNLQKNKEWLHKVLYTDMQAYDSEYSGTNVSGLLEDILHSMKFENNSISVVLYSDGDTTDEDKENTYKILEIYKNLNIPINIIAVGTPDGSDVEFKYNVLNYQKIEGLTGDASGQEYIASEEVVVKKIQSKLDEEYLKAIASYTGGFYHATYSGTTGLDDLSKKISKSYKNGSSHPFIPGNKKSYSFYFLIIPLIFLIYDYYLRGRMDNLINFLWNKSP